MNDFYLSLISFEKKGFRHLTSIMASAKAAGVSGPFIISCDDGDVFYLKRERSTIHFRRLNLIPDSAHNLVPYKARADETTERLSLFGFPIGKDPTNFKMGDRKANKCYIKTAELAHRLGEAAENLKSITAI